MTQLEEEVKTVIKDIYKAEYVGSLKITLLDNCYILRLGLNKDERPLFIAFEGSKDEFMKYLKLELRTRRLSETYFYYGEKLYRNHEKCCLE